MIAAAAMSRAEYIAWLARVAEARASESGGEGK